MLILENITYQTAKKAFNNSSKRKIKFAINETIVTSKQTARVRSQTLLEWSEAIPLPLFFNTQYQFEIFQQHKFGYNPEEFAVATGKIIVSEEDRFCTWQAQTERGNKAGFLSANIRRKLRYAPDVSTSPPEAQIVSISSIIAHISDLKQKRGYIVLTVDSKQYSTQLSKSKSGELLFTECIQIQKTDDLVDAKVEVFEYNAKDDSSTLLATGTIKLDEKHPEKRVIVKNDKGAPAGDIFVDYKISSKQVYTASKQLTKIVQHQRSKMTASRLDNTMNASRTISVVKNLGQYAIRLPLNKKDRVSVVNHNTKIFMPTERRFLEYKDKANNNVSYLKDRSSMDFKDGHAKVYYKGASIGKGNKLDFTALQKSTPGVGGYNLPSIWDRY